MDPIPASSPWIERATRIGDGLLDTARSLADGSLSWERGYGVDFSAVEDAGIFNGRIGEGLFLAALHAATGEPRFDDAARRAIEPLRAGLPDPGYRATLVRRIGLGLTGVGSVVYAFLRIGDFLRDPALREAARAAASAVTEEAVGADAQYEVFWGTAGALLGLMALADAEGAGVNGAVHRCAEHLLAHRVADPESGRLAWATFEPAPVAGFAHGSTGIAHALLQLHRREPDPRLYDAVMEAFAFERTVYREDINEWPDARGQEERILSAWCHGSGGIGFSRLSALGLARGEDDAAIADDLLKALRKVNTRKLLPWDNICCGNFGRIDLLLTAGLRLGNPSLCGVARVIARLCVERAGEGSFRIPGEEEGPQFTPGLWQGEPGIGYTLLRLAAPERFPSLLVFE